MSLRKKSFDLLNMIARSLSQQDSSNVLNFPSYNHIFGPTSYQNRNQKSLKFIVMVLKKKTFSWPSTLDNICSPNICVTRWKTCRQLKTGSKFVTQLKLCHTPTWSSIIKTASFKLRFHFLSYLWEYFWTVSKAYTELKFVATVTIGSRVNFLPTV